MRGFFQKAWLLYYAIEIAGVGLRALFWCLEQTSLQLANRPRILQNWRFTIPSGFVKVNRFLILGLALKAFDFVRFFERHFLALWSSPAFLRQDFDPAAVKERLWLRYYATELFHVNWLDFKASLRDVYGLLSLLRDTHINLRVRMWVVFLSDHRQFFYSEPLKLVDQILLIWFAFKQIWHFITFQEWNGILFNRAILRPNRGGIKRLWAIIYLYGVLDLLKDLGVLKGLALPYCFVVI